MLTVLRPCCPPCWTCATADRFGAVGIRHCTVKQATMPASAIVAPGHNDSVLYLEVLPSYKLLASGGEVRPMGRLRQHACGAR